jgi:SAM-dependent methyltransferase
MPPIDDFISLLTAALAEGRYVKLSLKGYSGKDADLKSIDIARILIKREEKLSLTYHYKTKDIVKNHVPDEAIDMIARYLEKDFSSAILHTTDYDLTFPAMKKVQPRFKQAPPLSHDRQKHRHVDPTRPYLQALKITDSHGTVYKNAQDKYKQIDKYIEIVGGLIQGLAAGKIRHIADMGSGKGYLTFALYDYLHHVIDRPAHITGVEYRQDMVDLCNDIARKEQFKNLSFVQSSIEKFDTKSIDMLVALHACDTATDEAIYKGISANATLIIVAPCCHKQIRAEIETTRQHNDLDFLTQYGIFLERHAEMLTDGLRALILNYMGYSTKVFEFISDSHTPKNVMIVAIKEEKKKIKDPAILKSIHNAKSYFGIRYHYLEKLLDIKTA